MKRTISIFGSCVSRDMFPADQEKYQVQQYVSFTSPMSIYQPAGDRHIETEELADFQNATNFMKRCLMLDHNKESMQYLGARISDYLLLDLADIRLKLLKYDGGNVTTFVNSVLLNAELFKERFGDYELHSPLTFSEEEWNSCIDWFCEQLQKLYGTNNIILHEFYMAEEYWDKSQQIKRFAENYEVPQINAMLRRMYDRCKARLEGCHIIRMPEHVLADAFQKWGLHPMHFHEYYYEYAYEALQLITSGCPDEEKALEALRNQYSERFANVRDRLQLQMLEAQQKTQSYNLHKITEYSNYFCSIIETYDACLQHLKDFCQEKEIQSVAVWGDFLTTNALLSMLEKCGVGLDYVIGKWNNHKPTPLYAPDSEQFPETDAIIICDIMAIHKTKSELKGRTEIPVYSIYEILPKLKS